MPGKGNPLLSVRIPPELDELLPKERGERSRITIEALKAYLQPPSSSDELNQVKQRLHQLETLMQAVRRHFPL